MDSTQGKYKLKKEMLLKSITLIIRSKKSYPWELLALDDYSNNTYLVLFFFFGRVFDLDRRNPTPPIERKVFAMKEHTNLRANPFQGGEGYPSCSHL